MIKREELKAHLTNAIWQLLHVSKQLKLIAQEASRDWKELFFEKEEFQFIVAYAIEYYGIENGVSIVHPKSAKAYKKFTFNILRQLKDKSHEIERKTSTLTQHSECSALFELLRPLIADLIHDITLELENKIATADSLPYLPHTVSPFRYIYNRTNVYEDDVLVDTNDRNVSYVGIDNKAQDDSRFEPNGPNCYAFTYGLEGYPPVLEFPMRLVSYTPNKVVFKGMPFRGFSLETNQVELRDFSEMGLEVYYNDLGSISKIHKITFHPGYQELLTTHHSESKQHIII